MFWHRRKLLAMEEQLENISAKLNENLASGFDGLSKGHSALQQSLDKIENEILSLQQVQDKMLNLLVSLVGNQRAGQEELVGMVESQRDPLVKLLDLIGAQGDSMKALDETIAELKEFQEHNWQEYAVLNEKVLSALQGTEHTISEKVEEQGVSVIESQNNSSKVLSGAILEVRALLNQGQQNSAQRGNRLMEALQVVERTLSDKVTDQTASIKGDMDSIKREISAQGGTIRAIDTATQRVGSDMETLDEAMRLLLVNTLLNNLPE